MGNFFRDLRFGIRTLFKSPILTLTAILTLGIGIGANTAMFSVVDALILRRLPVHEPGELVLFGNGQAVGSFDGYPNSSANLFSYPMFRQMQRENQIFSEMAAIKSITFDMHGRVASASDVETLRVQLVSGSYFPTLQIAPGSGRLFTDEDDRSPGSHPIAVASRAWWKKRFGDAPFSSDKTVTLGSTIYSIVGLAPESFFGTTVGDAPNLWVPLSMETQINPGWNGLTNFMFQAHYLIGRLKPGVELPRAQSEINSIYKRLLLDHAGPKPSRQDADAIARARIELTPAANGLSPLRDQFSTPLNILFGVVATVLLIACANLANLMLARAMARHREIAIRMAIGADRMRLVRQLLTESLLLAALGSVAGIIFAAWCSHLLVAMVATTQPIPLAATIDLRALGFTTAVCLVAAILFGLAPALKATRMEDNLNLKEGKGLVAGGARSRFGRILLVGQVALSLALLAGAGLFLRTLVNLSHADTGFDRRNVLLFDVDFPSAQYNEDARLQQRYREIEREVAALPGIEAASFSFFTFNQGAWSSKVDTDSVPASASPRVTHNVVGPGYFAVMGIPLLAGRGLSESDGENSLRVAVVNETFARKLFPKSSAVGQRFRVGDSFHEIIGVVKDAKYEHLNENPRAAAYYAHAQRQQYLGDFEVRFRGDRASALAAVHSAFAKIDRNIPLTLPRTLVEEVNRSIVDQRLIARISGAFAIAALFLACVGIYGVTAYGVSRQTREIGIRMALGAQRRQVFSMVMRQTGNVLAFGVFLGVPSVITLQSIVTTQLYGVPPIDLLSTMVAAALLVAAALFATFLPARAAARLEPSEALRQE